MSVNAPVPYPDTRITLWARSLGIVAVGLGGLLISYAALSVQRSVAEVQQSLAEAQKRNADEDLALRHRTFDYQRQTDEARLASAVIPSLKCNDDLQRALGLELLARSAPSQAGPIAASVLLKCAALSPESRTEVSKVQDTSRVQQATNDFLTRVNNARDYYRSRFAPGIAARLFNDAASRVPEALDRQVNRDELAMARQAYDRGAFDAAADHFELAFRNIPGRP